MMHMCPYCAIKKFYLKIRIWNLVNLMNIRIVLMNILPFLKIEFLCFKFFLIPFKAFINALSFLDNIFIDFSLQY